MRPAGAACGLTLSEARSRLDQRRFSRPNTHFAAFFKLYKKIIFSQANLQKFAKFLRILQIFLKNFLEYFRKNVNVCRISQDVSDFLTEFCKIFGRKGNARFSKKNIAIFYKKKLYCRAVRRSALCRSRRELSNAYLLAKFGFDTAENEPSKVCPVDRSNGGLGQADTASHRPTPAAADASRVNCCTW